MKKRIRKNRVSNTEFMAALRRALRLPVRGDAEEESGGLPVHELLEGPTLKYFEPPPYEPSLRSFVNARTGEKLNAARPVVLRSKR